MVSPHGLRQVLVSSVIGVLYTKIFDEDQDFDSSSFGYTIGEPRYLDPFLPLLKLAWDNDIVTVVACVNDGSPLGNWSPQRFGRFNNPLITACRLDERGDQAVGNGVESPANTGPDRNYFECAGHKDIYAIAQGLRLPQSNSQTLFDPNSGRPKLPPNSYYNGVAGSSYAAPQIAALACYIDGSSQFQPLAAGTVAQERKQQIVGLMRTETNLDALGAACNGIREQAIADSTTEPTPTSSAEPSPDPPQATCLSQIGDQSYLIRIFTNYIKDEGDALRDSIINACFDGEFDGWKVVHSDTPFVKDGLTWIAPAYYEFSLGFVPKEYVSYCVGEAVKAAGGPELNDCLDSPLANPP